MTSLQFEIRWLLEHSQKGSSILLLKLTNRDLERFTNPFSNFPGGDNLWAHCLDAVRTLGHVTCRNPIRAMRKRWGAQSQSAARGVQNVNFNDKWLLKCIRRITIYEKFQTGMNLMVEVANFEWNWSNLENVEIYVNDFEEEALPDWIGAGLCAHPKWPSRTEARCLAAWRVQADRLLVFFLGRHRSWDFRSSACMSAYIGDLHHICQFCAKARNQSCHERG